jgi:hypothetical protein
MGALIKKTESRSGRHIFEASGPSLPFPNYQSGGGIARCCRHNQASWPECLFMADTVEKVSAKEMWNWNLKQPRQLDF